MRFSIVVCSRIKLRFCLSGFYVCFRCFSRRYEQGPFINSSRRSGGSTLLGKKKPSRKKKKPKLENIRRKRIENNIEQKIRENLKNIGLFLRVF